MTPTQLVSETIDRVLPAIEQAIRSGAIVSVEDARGRVRPLPV